MKKVVTRGIVLNRLNYGEADRILTIITPDHGKVRAIAKGVRKEKSKLAGGIELFSISNISYIPGKRDISMLISTRLQTNFGNIVKDLARTQLGYQVLKTIDKVTEDESGEEFYTLLAQTLLALNDSLDIVLVECWFGVRLPKLMGHEPNLSTDTKGTRLEASKTYRFDYEHMAFYLHTTGKYTDRHIKLMRLLQTQSPEKIAKIGESEDLLADCLALLKPIIRTYTN